MKYCALCCIAKDEDLFLKEWLAYHALIGFEHFIIYDNLSAVPIADFLRGWADPESVTVIRNSEPLSQKEVYGHCLENFGGRFMWLAFLDLDEFIRLPQGPDEADVRVFLSEFEPYAGLGLNWRFFSSAGHEKTPHGPVIANYTRSFGPDAHIKSIVRPAKIVSCAGPHSFYPKAGEAVVDVEHFPIPPGSPFSASVSDRAVVNHYFFKSRQCFAEKIAKGNPCNIERRMSEFEAHLGRADAEDARLLPHVAGVRAAVRAQRLPSAPARPSVPDDGALELARRLIAGNDEALGRQALVLLCALAAENEAEGTPRDALLALDIWSLRAEAARRRGSGDAALHCLKQAFRYGMTPHSYTEFANLMLERGRPEEARQALFILRALAAEGAGRNT